MWRVLLVLCFLDSAATVRWLKNTPDVGTGQPTSTNSTKTFSYVSELHIETLFSAKWLEPESERPDECLRNDNTCHVALSAATQTLALSSTNTIPSASTFESPTTTLAGPRDPPTIPIIPVISAPAVTHPSRGLSKAAVDSTNYGQSPIPLLAAQAQAQAQLQAESAASISASVQNVTKMALVAGFNYENCQGYPSLRHAIQDAWRVAKTLPMFGYSSDNIKVVTDEKNRPPPSCEEILQYFDWLVQGLSPGDRRLFMWSGHCISTFGQSEPCLVAADSTTISRSVLHNRLIARIPAGAELIIILDCCHAAGMVKANYCISQMEYKYESERIDGSETLSRLGPIAAPAIRPPPQYGSFQGLPVANPARFPPPTNTNQIPFGPPAHAPFRPNRGGLAGASPIMRPATETTPAMGKQIPFGRPVNVSPRPIRGGLAGAPPMMGPTTEMATVAGQNTKQIQARRKVVVGAPVLAQFQERRTDLVAPAGQVIVWAATGEKQKAFEASGGLENSVFTNALCKVFDTCVDGIVTHREVLKSVVDALDQENNWRKERDAKKVNRTPVNTRVQCAELLVSQQSPLHSSSPILNMSI